ncbi:MAG TPA: serine hydrolase domain-containing protein [Puia sp.]|uniref:serine hydrolase domain-containing protein n=1 Tax=Puia sp. TaxID=2045100 RepID=UPI002C32F2B8|nr:serine hydrolase domain-containing protein [Puia sp.]HVU98331.1 serine hydrolase domain-containing protein [Puia sp.]
MKKLILSVLTLLSFAQCLYAQSPGVTTEAAFQTAHPATYPSAQPLLIAPDPSVHLRRLARIDTFVNDCINKGWINGVVTLVVKNGHVVQYKAYGYADKEAGIPMRRDDLFRIASQTKAIISVAAMQLFEQGKFYLDEPISDFLPAFKDMKVVDKFNPADSSYTTVPAKRPITFRHLFTHTAGLDYPLIGTKEGKAIYAKAGIPSGLGEYDGDLKETMSKLATLPLTSQPGEKWQYSLSVDLLGALIEVISGKNLEDYLVQNLFNPLGMNDTRFNIPAEKAGRLTKVYTEDSVHHIIPWTKQRTTIDPNYPLAHKRYFSGGAGLTSTAWDYAIFLQALLNGGSYNGARILAPRTVEMMTTGQLSFLFNETDNFGLGFGITSALSAAREVRGEGTFAWGGYFGTTYWADPKNHVIGLVMTQQSPNSHGDFEHRLEQVIYQSFVR